MKRLTRKRAGRKKRSKNNKQVLTQEMFTLMILIQKNDLKLCFLLTFSAV